MIVALAQANSEGGIRPDYVDYECAEYEDERDDEPTFEENRGHDL
jgi:hypothetical protein